MPFSHTWETIKEEYQNKDPQSISENSGVEYDYSREEFILNYCGNTFRVSYPGAHLEGAPFSVSLEEKIVFLQYLCWAKSVPPRGKWLSFLELPFGQHHHVPFQKEAIFPLAAKYGNNLSEFCRAGESWGEEQNFSDASFLIRVFPLINLLVILRRGDDEFPPHANVLFDSASPYHLPTATLYVMGIKVVERIWL